MNNNIEYVELHERMKESYMSYAIATIVDRSLPDVRDGCLPIHRRILYAMYNRGLTYDKPYAKSSEPVSETLKIHNHGDSSAYGSLALLTDRNETLLHPFLDGDGSFGKVYSTDSPSHMRYTFCKLNKFSEEMFYGLKQNAVKLVGEDGHFQPIVLPNTYPNILVKPNSAIAVGEACNWGSFPLSEVCDVTERYLKDKNIDIVEYLTPDFSTGGQLIYNKLQLKSIYETGRGGICLRSKYRYIEDENIIEVYEIPYSTTAQKIIKEITEKMDKYKDIIDVRDETGFNKEKNVEELKISIDVKKSTNAHLLMAKLLKDTSLETNFSFNMNCLVNNSPKVLGIKSILDNWITFRKECIINTMNYDLEKKRKTLHLLLGLKQVLLDIDKAIEIIRYSNNSVKDLINYFSIDDEQSSYVIEIKLKNINKDFIIKQIKDIEQLQSEVTDLEINIKDENYIINIILSDLERVKKEYNQPRKTEIIYEDTVNKVSQHDLIEDFTTTIVFTREQYFKKTRRYSEVQNVKDGDEVKTIIQCSNKDKAIFISSLGNAYFLNLWEQDEQLPSKMGQYLQNLLQLEKDETIIGMLSTNSYKGEVVIVYPDSHLAIIPLESYKTKQNSTRVKNCLAKKLGLPILITQITNDVDIEFIDCFNNTKVLNTNGINRKDTKNAQGITAWGSKKKGFNVVSASVITNKQ